MHFCSFYKNVPVIGMGEMMSKRNVFPYFAILLLLQNFNILFAKKRDFSGFFRARGSFIEKCAYF